jgi:hypothetical protein
MIAKTLFTRLREWLFGKQTESGPAVAHDPLRKILICSLLPIRREIPGPLTVRQFSVICNVNRKPCTARLSRRAGGMNEYAIYEQTFVHGFEYQPGPYGQIVIQDDQSLVVETTSGAEVTITVSDFNE